MGRDCAGQQKVYQWCILGHPDRRALAGFTSGLWQVGHDPSAVHPMAQERYLGKNIGSSYPGSGLRMADD